MQNGRYGAVDRSALVVARLLDRTAEAAKAPVERLRHAAAYRLGNEALGRPVASPELVERREAVGLTAGVAVVLDDPIAVRRVRERDIEQLRVLLGLRRLGQIRQRAQI